jgi:formate hydrogenlyase subunit 3/multisubunit Na+/H+ antiporter MnhD subunit
MEEVFFASLIALTAVLAGLYSFYYGRKDLVALLGLTALAQACVALWFVSSVMLLFFVFYKKIGYGGFAALNMFAAVLMTNFLMKIFTIYSLPFFAVAEAAIVFACVLAVYGIFEDGLRKYLVISTYAQMLLAAVDLSIGGMTNHVSAFGVALILNYFLAGLCLLLTVGVLAKKTEKISELEGSYFKDKYDDAFATIACLSLSGIPIFNIFFAKWALFTESYAISPMLTVFELFAAVLMFIMYYKIVYVLLVGEGKPKKTPKLLTAINGALALSCIVLGVVPQLQNIITGYLVGL